MEDKSNPVYIKKLVVLGWTDWQTDGGQE
jgi:hypothetical protein